MGGTAMSIVFQIDKRTGIKYDYENEAYWEKEKSIGFLGNRTQREAFCGIYCLDLTFLHQETDAGG